MLSLDKLSAYAADEHVSASDLTSLPSPELGASVFSLVKCHIGLILRPF